MGRFLLCLLLRHPAWKGDTNSPKEALPGDCLWTEFVHVNRLDLICVTNGYYHAVSSCACICLKVNAEERRYEFCKHMDDIPVTLDEVFCFSDCIVMFILGPAVLACLNSEHLALEEIKPSFRLACWRA